MSELKSFTTGEPRTLIEAKEANKLVDAINAILRLTVSPQGCGSLKVSDQNVVLDLNPLMKNIADQVIAKMTIKVVCNGDGTITATLSTRP